MELIVLGSSGSRPVRSRPTSGYLIAHEGTALWCDAGSGTFLPLLDEIAASDLDAVLLSHLHPDHCVDLFAMYQHLAYDPAGEGSIRVLAPEGAAERFGGFLGAGADHRIYRVLQFEVIRHGDEIMAGGVRLTFSAANHRVPAVATRFEAAGRALVYTGDTGPSADVGALAENVDVLLAEATLQDESAAYAFHMSARQAGEMARKAGAARLILTHLSPTLDPDRSVAEAAEGYGARPELAVPGFRTVI